MFLLGTCRVKAIPLKTRNITPIAFFFTLAELL